MLLVAAAALAREPKVPEGWRFELPPGNAQAGEQAFAKMQCYSCHTVPGKQFADPSQKPGDVGPELTAAYARLPQEYLAEGMERLDGVAHGLIVAAQGLGDDAGVLAMRAGQQNLAAAHHKCIGRPSTLLKGMLFGGA